MKLIPLDALVAEIEKRRESNAKEKFFGRLVEDNYLLDFLNTLEVKEVDLEKEIDNYIYTNNGRQRLALELDWKQCNITFKGKKLIDFARHFFELGIKAQKGENE